MSSVSVLKIPKTVVGVRVVDKPARDGLLTRSEAALLQGAGEIELLKIRTEELEAELQETRETAYKSGFDDGLAAASQQHQEALDSNARDFQSLAAKLRAEFDDLLTRLEEPLMRLAFRVAEKILSAPLPETFKQDSLVSRIQAFLKEVLQEGSVIIHVSPEQLTQLQSKEVAAKVQQTFPGALNYVADGNLRPGECLIETPQHIIEGRYEEQLDILAGNLS